MPNRQKLDDQTARKLFLEQAAAYYAELNATIQNAPIGKGFDHAETFAVAHGRELIRQSLETIVQQQIDHIEKKRDAFLHEMRNEKTAPWQPKEKTNERARQHQN